MLSKISPRVGDVVKYQLLENAEALGAIVTEQDAKEDAREY